MKAIYNKNKEIINYLIVGFLTVLVNLIAFFVLRTVCFKSDNQLNIQISVVISWIVAVLFAFFTNKKYVFNSKTKGKQNAYEMIKFFLSRVATLFIEMFGMWLLTSVMSMNDKISKILIQIIVIVLNYIFSKVFVFKKA